MIDRVISPNHPPSLSPELLKSTVSINLEGAFFAVQAAARQMKEQSPQGGSIIGVSSISALVGGAGQTHYTPTKAGILSLMQSCACALGPYNIRCNALLPGTIRTQLNDEDLADPKKKEYMEGRIPLRRLGQPHVCTLILTESDTLIASQDLAGPAVFLASNLSSYVVSFRRSGAQTIEADYCIQSGAQLLVDGGAFVNFQ